MNARSKFAMLVVSGQLSDGDRIAVDGYRLFRSKRNRRFVNWSVRGWLFYRVHTRKRDGALQLRSDGFTFRESTKESVLQGCKSVVESDGDDFLMGKKGGTLHNEVLSELLPILLDDAMPRAL